MKAWLKGGLIGIMLFFIYFILGSLISKVKPPIQEFIFIFLYILFYCIMIGLLIDSINYGWYYWIKGGIWMVVIFSFPFFPVYLIISNPLAVVLFDCSTDGFTLICNEIYQIISYIASIIIFFIAGAFIGFIISKFKSHGDNK